MKKDSYYFYYHYYYYTIMKFAFISTKREITRRMTRGDLLQCVTYLAKTQTVHCTSLSLNL